jgi:hypothetical protein
MVFFYGCDSSKSPSISEHEDIVAVIEKLPHCLYNPASLNEIFLNDAMLIRDTHYHGLKYEFRGINEIGEFHNSVGRHWIDVKTSSKKIKVENGRAQVEYTMSYYVSFDTGGRFDVTVGCSAEMVKKGPKWMIRETIIRDY